MLLAGDLLDPLTEAVDVVTANLPYIRSGDLDSLAPEVREWEPRSALDGGAGGLDAFRAFAAQVGAHLAPGPHAVLLEVGAGQAREVAALLTSAVGGDVRLHRDLGGIERVVEVRAGY